MTPDDSTGTPQPNTLEAYLRQGWVLHTTGKQDEAEESFRKAIAQDPKSVDGYYGLGLVLKAQDRRQDMVQAFQQVISLIDDNALSDWARGRMLRRLSKGHINQAKEGDWNLEKEIWQKRD